MLNTFAPTLASAGVWRHGQKWFQIGDEAENYLGDFHKSIRFELPSFAASTRLGELNPLPERPQQLGDTLHHSIDQIAQLRNFIAELHQLFA